ncbi:cobalamin B12-binding domain-containing protein [Desulfotomaculum copahuensis]|uniref:Methyltransferase n=1 Tax=Desulfotomaculum copahuensis TaxID=1838280 RepID=A0A1B7LJE6_9FIRM|nr:corrinoid protein [Desulfotomaculum copahuensis]OAT86684.1 methyltransferase [Desulfotomaculum copahuensis]
MSLLAEIKAATIAGKAPVVEDLTRQALENGLTLDDIITDGYIAAMTVVGEKFKNNEIFVPEMLVAARAMKMGLKVLEPAITAAGERKYLGKIILGTVQGDLHDIGKNLVGMMLQGAGYEVIDLGTDVKAEKFITAIKEHQPQVVGLSALLTTTMRFMGETVKAIGDAYQGQVKVIVGGAPVSERFAGEIGADGYAADAGSAVDRVRELIGRD